MRSLWCHYPVRVPNLLRLNIRGKTFACQSVFLSLRWGTPDIGVQFHYLLDLHYKPLACDACRGCPPHVALGGIASQPACPSPHPRAIGLCGHPDLLGYRELLEPPSFQEPQTLSFFVCLFIIICVVCVLRLGQDIKCPGTTV